jgi:hypothetical protein
LKDYDYEDLDCEETVSVGGEDRIISNVSPIDRGHSLLLPSVDLCKPQVGPMVLHHAMT